jgi:hypothetical protein
MIGHRALAQQFSADVINNKTDNEGPKKLYAGNAKERVEVESSNPMMGHTAVILDESQNRYTVLMTERHMYMDAPAMMVRPLITQFWHVQDVNDACPQWRKTAKQAGTLKNWGSCTKIGSDTLNGRSASSMKAFRTRARRVISGSTRNFIV